MGLDQYLKARKYVGDWDYKGADTEERQTYAVIMAAIGKRGFRCEGSPHLYVEVSVAYWRKANQIHAWFVENVQKGEDDCGDYYVSHEQLETLRDTCKTVLASSKLVSGKVKNGSRSVAGGGYEDCIEDGQVMENHAVAQELLPCQSGFFFGSTDYNQWYYSDLQRTVDQIDAVLTQFEDWDFQYSSSW